MSLLDAFRERRPFPGQDPWVVAHEGALLLLQSAGGNRRIVVKRFRELDRMDRNVETVIWPPSGRSTHLRQIWAPELHHIDGRWYVYFAASDGRMAIAPTPSSPRTPSGRTGSSGPSTTSVTMCGPST